MLDLGDRDGAFERGRHVALERSRRLEPGRLLADDLAKAGDRVLQVGLRGEIIGPRAGEAGLGLRHIGSGHLADLEAVLGLAKLLLEHLDVAVAQIQDRRVAQHVHVGLRAALQHALLDVAQGFPRAEHVRFGRP